jgi:hypothetical protein
MIKMIKMITNCNEPAPAARTTAQSPGDASAGTARWRAARTPASSIGQIWLRVKFG